MKRILEVKKKIGNLSKNSTNPFFKSAYLDLNDLLNAVEPLLQEQGLMLLQPLQDGSVITQIWDVEENIMLVSSWLVIPPLTDPQKLGSCITYFRRYTLKSLLAIAEGDDDGNLASKPAPKKKFKDGEFKQSLTLNKSQMLKVLDTFELTNGQTLELTVKIEALNN